MARATELRLRNALEEYVAAHRGDNPRGSIRGANTELVKQAEALLGGLSPTASEESTPGSRAAGSPGRAIDSAAERAREVLGVTRAGAGNGDPAAG